MGLIAEGDQLVGCSEETTMGRYSFQGTRDVMAFFYWPPNVAGKSIYSFLSLDVSCLCPTLLFNMNLMLIHAYVHLVGG